MERTTTIESEVDVEVRTETRGNDEVSVENERAPCDVPPRRARSNSVIDSIGRADLIVPSAHNATPRKRSTSHYHSLSNRDRCSINSEASFAVDLCKRVERVSPFNDACDAHASYRPESISGIEDNLAVGPPSIRVARMSVSKDAECYNMSHRNRGKCVIFNHEEFDTGFDRREGSTTDALRLKKSFAKLGFDIEVHNDFTHVEVMSEIDKLSQFDHTDNDCLCIIVLTHGLHNDLICAKDAAYKSDKIWKPFTACTSLAGKPKLFFFQACRGDELDGGILLCARSLITSETDSVASYKIPTHADFLIAHSSVQGFYTWRNPEKGTWYIQCLCDILDEHGTKLDLMSLLTMTARKVATDYTSRNIDDPMMNEKKQVPSVTTMLIRSVYFSPKSDT